MNRAPQFETLSDLDLAAVTGGDEGPGIICPPDGGVLYENDPIFEPAIPEPRRPRFFPIPELLY